MLLLLAAFASPIDPFSTDLASAPRLSPDAHRVAYVRRRWDKEADGTIQDLWLHDRRTGTTRLTFRDRWIESPTWSEAGD